MPPDADPGKFILSDGKLNGKPVVSKPLSLAELFALYLEKLPAGAKEESTLQGEVIHHNHLLRHLKAATIASTLAVSDLQAYVQKRLRDRHHKKGIRPDTIKKELTTFRLVWNWAVDQGYLTGPAPVKGIKFPKRDQKPPFMTLDEIQRVIARGGLTPEQEKEFWDSLFLTKAETQAVLDHVRLSARHPFIYPMFVFVAHTGARRSEILRSQIDDFDFWLPNGAYPREEEKPVQGHDLSPSSNDRPLVQDDDRVVRPTSRWSIHHLRDPRDGSRKGGDRVCGPNLIGSTLPFQANAQELPMGQDQRLPHFPAFFRLQPRCWRRRSAVD